MIYDRLLTVYELDRAASPFSRKLKNPVEFYYKELEVYSSRYYRAQQSGEQIDVLAELPRVPGEPRITPNNYCILDEGEIYRVVQAQYGSDNNGLPVTILSLRMEEGKYDILGP